jgi:hypothetical protein
LTVLHPRVIEILDFALAPENAACNTTQPDICGNSLARGFAAVHGWNPAFPALVAARGLRHLPPRALRHAAPAAIVLTSGAGPRQEAPMATIEILSPAALGPSEERPLAPRLSSLRGRILGIRVDRAWQSFHRWADELAALARARLGVADVVVFDPEARIGSPEAESDKVVAFARRVDAAVVGLGT